MKITFWCDNNANVYSKREESFAPEDLGLEKEEWESMSEDEKHEYVKDWAMERFDYGIRED